MYHHSQTTQVLMHNNTPNDIDIIIEENTPSVKQNAELKITKTQLQLILKKFISFEECSERDKKIYTQNQDSIKLLRPPMGESNFGNTWPYFCRVQNIMVKAYNKEQLKLSQFQQFQMFFRLDKKKIKLMNYPDPMVLQTLRFAIYNKQQIPYSLVKVVIQMSKTNMVKQWEDGYSLIYKAFTQDVISLGFEPPLDLYVEFINSGLIRPSQQELNEVFTRNQFLFKSISNKKQFYSSPVKKKRLIYNQFPYILEIYEKICIKGQSGLNFGGLKLYINTIISFLEFHNEDYLLERYLPEVKCRYIKLKTQMSQTDIQYLFTAIKGFQSLCLQDFKLLYHTKPKSQPLMREHEVNSWTQFWQIEELCSKMLTKKDFHLSKKQLQQMGQLLNFQKSLSADIVKINIIFIIFREQSYSSYEFSKPLVKNILWVFKNIPDKKKKKQCCYILLHQFFKLIDKIGPSKKIQILKQYTFPQQQIDDILDEGRQLALDILLNQKQKNLVFQQAKYSLYMGYIKALINQTTNKNIKRKALDLYTKLRKICKYQNKDLSYYEDNLFKANQLIDFLESQTKNGTKVSIQCVNSLLKVLLMNRKTNIRKSCLNTLRYVIRNVQDGQQLPERFEYTLIRLITNIYFQSNIAAQCKEQIIKLIVDCIGLSGTYTHLDLSVKFLLQIYTTTPNNHPLNTNSSYGIYKIAINFKESSLKNFSTAKQFLEDFAFKMLKTYKHDFQPNSKGSVNILCAIIALAQNQILLPPEVIQQLTIIASKYRNFTDVALIGLIFYIKNEQSLQVSQRSLLNICNILKQSKNNQIMAVCILIELFQKYENFPKSVKAKLGQLAKVKKCQSDSCQHLCNFYRNQIKDKQ